MTNGCAVLRLMRLILVVCGLVSMLAAVPSAWAQSDAAAATPAADPVEGSALSRDQAKALSDLLSDPAARGAIVQELQRIAAGEGAGQPAAAVDTPAADSSIGRRIADITQFVAELAVARVLAVVEQLSQAPQALAAVGAVRADLILDAVTDLLLVMTTTIVLFLLLRWVARGVYRRMGAKAEISGATRTVAIIVFCVLVDALTVVLAWAGGYLLALLVFGEVGEIGIRQALYLNAFLVVEMVKVAMRTVLSPTSAALRPMNIPDRGAGVLSGWLNLVISLVGYGQLLVVPIVNENVSVFAGYGVSSLLSVLAVAILIGLVLVYRRAVANWLLGERALEQRSAMLRFLARYWHMPVLLYLAGLFVIVLARPGDILIPLLVVSLQIACLAIAGTVLDTFLKRAMKRGVHLPETVMLRLPLLERRLNDFLPQVLTFVRLVIIVVILAFSFQLIGLLNVETWLNSQFGAHFTSVLISVLFIVLLTFAIWLALSSWVDYRLNPDFGSIASARERTLLTLLKNAATILLIIITIMFVFSEIGIDIAPLIASAGVFGLAIGFGAQKLVQDIITGIFIQFENAINVGDIVTVSGTTGVVERLTIRSVSLRDLQGIYHIIPFSSVDMVSNFMRGFAYFVCDMGIAYRESVDDAKQAMFDAFAELRAKPEFDKDILEDLQWQGLHAFGDSAVVLRARIKCVGGRNFAVGRAYNEVLKRIFDERGIEIPFPHQTIYFGEDKQGEAPPMRMVMTRKAGPDAGKADAGKADVGKADVGKAPA